MNSYKRDVDVRSSHFAKAAITLFNACKLNLSIAIVLAPVGAMFFCSTAASAKPIYFPTRGCGTNCRVETMQLTPATQMENGWTKVLVQHRTIIKSFDGVESLGRGSGGKIWIFANCRDGLIAFGASSDRSDAQYQSIFTVDGYPKNTTVTGNVFNTHKVICQAFD